MCLICLDFDEPETHFCGDAHGGNFAAWCDRCIDDFWSFLNPEGAAPGQLTFRFLAVDGIDRPVYSLAQVAGRSVN